MKHEPKPHETDPRQEALEEAAYTAWQFAAAFQGLELGQETSQIRPPEGDQWKWVHEAVGDFTIQPEEVTELALQYFRDTLDVIYPEEGSEFFQRVRLEAIRRNREKRAKFAIKRAVTKRIFLED